MTLQCIYFDLQSPIACLTPYTQHQIPGCCWYVVCNVL